MIDNSLVGTRTCEGRHQSNLFQDAEMMYEDFQSKSPKTLFVKKGNKLPETFLLAVLFKVVSPQ
jgi:hypothetical protein